MHAGGRCVFLSLDTRQGPYHLCFGHLYTKVVVWFGSGTLPASLLSVAMITCRTRLFVADHSRSTDDWFLLNSGGRQMCFRRLFLCLLVLSAVLLTRSLLVAQTTVSQGSIQGTITDPSGAVVGGANITITHKATGQVITTTSTGSGTFNSGGL